MRLVIINFFNCYALKLPIYISFPSLLYSYLISELNYILPLFHLMLILQIIMSFYILFLPLLSLWHNNMRLLSKLDYTEPSTYPQDMSFTRSTS